MGRTANGRTRKVGNRKRTLPFKYNNEEMCSGIAAWCNNKPKRLTDEDYEGRSVITRSREFTREHGTRIKRFICLANLKR